MQFIVGFGIVDNIRDWSISSLKEGDKREGGGGAGRVQLQFSCIMRACTSNHSDKLTPPPKKGIILYQKSFLCLNLLKAKFTLEFNKII